MAYTESERALLRELGRRKAEIGHLPVQAQTARLWRELNGLRPTRPLVWINEIPWTELEARVPELRCRCADAFLAGIERSLRQELYQWDHFVRPRGIVHQWHTPWDLAVRWYGVEPLLMDLSDRPELVASVAERVCRATGEVLDRQQALGMLDVGSGNWRVGSGGLGFSDELPQHVQGRAATPADQWGCGNAQIFSEVSPEMHEEFSLRFERPIMERFGLSYYGCCEPLHRKIGILRRVRNLRKISISPKADVRVAAEAIGRDYVISLKPNPAYLAPDTFRPEQAQANLRESLAAMPGACVEVILKDITTVRNEPERLDQWAAAAMRVVSSVERLPVEFMLCANEGRP
jgi:hypothetical protein